MAYGSNILKTDAAYYTLSNASIVNGVLNINTGGSATQQLTIADISAVTSKLCFTGIIANEYADRYEPDIRVVVYTKMESELAYSKAILYPVQVDPNKYVCEFNMQEGTYEIMYVSIQADKPVTFTLWELCAEAPDESAIVEINGVKQALAKLLYDYNTSVFSGDQNETTIALITCRLLQNTDVQGHLIFTFTNTHACCMTIRFYDNNSEELFSPIYYDLKPGRNSIGVPHAYLSRLAGIHTFYITAQVSSGTFTMPVRGVLFTIDAGYLAIRELELAMDVTDVALKQLGVDEGPSEIYAVGIDAGIAYVRKHAYKVTNSNVGWTAVGQLGEAVSAAVEFDGNWIQRPDADQFTIETYEEPWYFWVTPTGELKACEGLPTEDNVITLDTDVISEVKAVRGYSSLIYPEQDQGLIVVYIKSDGIPRYRQHKYMSASHSVAWDNVVYSLNVPANRYSFINVHRLNDFRVGIELSGSINNLWLITDRTYVGQSIYPEHTSITIDDSKKFFQIYTADYTFPETSIVFVDQEVIEETDEFGQVTYHYKFIVRLQYELYADEAFWPLFDRFTFTNANVERIENVTWEHADGHTDITVTFNEAPTSLLVTGVINANPTMRIFDGTYESYYDKSIEIVWDVTNYIYAYSDGNDNASINIANGSIDIYPLRNLIASIHDDSNINIGMATTNIATVNISKETMDDSSTLGINNASIIVYKTEDAPV